MYTKDTAVASIINDPVFGDYGRLLFPVHPGHLKGDTLGQIQMTFYSNIDPDKTVEILNYFHDKAAAGDSIFFELYSPEEKAADPAKKDTGLFFFKGQPDSKVAVCNAARGIPVEFHCYEGMGHGFGLGTGTAAKGWEKEAVAFWKNQMK